MGRTIEGISDSELRKRMGETFADLQGSVQDLGDDGSELLARIGERYAVTIDKEAESAAERAGARRRSFVRIDLHPKLTHFAA